MDNDVLARLETYAPPIPDAKDFPVPEAIYEDMPQGVTEPAPDVPNMLDDATWAERDKMLAETFRFGEPEPRPAWLDEIGVDIPNFDPAAPPPLYDAGSDTAYWVGIYSDPATPKQGITSLLAVTRDAEGTPQAQLAPVAIGEPEYAQQTAEYLLKVAERTGDVDRMLESAEGLAVASQDHPSWDSQSRENTLRDINLDLA